MYPGSLCLLYCCTPSLPGKEKSRSRRDHNSVLVLEPRERAVLKADQSNSSYLLSVPSYPTLALLEEMTEFCGLLLGLAQKSFATV